MNFRRRDVTIIKMQMHKEYRHYLKKKTKVENLALKYWEMK